MHVPNDCCIQWYWDWDQFSQLAIKFSLAVMISAWYEDQVPRAALRAASIVYCTGLTWTPLHWSSWILIDCPSCRTLMANQTTPYITKACCRLQPYGPYSIPSVCCPLRSWPGFPGKLIKCHQRKMLWYDVMQWHDWLVVWNIFYSSIYWEESSQLTHIFQRGRYTTNQMRFQHVPTIFHCPGSCPAWSLRTHVGGPRLDVDRWWNECCTPCPCCPCWCRSRPGTDMLREHARGVLASAFTHKPTMG